jgi:hypothetical protein
MPSKSNRRIPHIGFLLLYLLAGVIGIAGAALLLYAALIALHPVRDQGETQWYEAVAMIPMVPGVLMLSGAGWLFRIARDR